MEVLRSIDLKRSRPEVAKSCTMLEETHLFCSLYQSRFHSTPTKHPPPTTFDDPAFFWWLGVVRLAFCKSESRCCGRTLEPRDQFRVCGINEGYDGETFEVNASVSSRHH